MTSQAPGKVSKNICDGKGKKYRLWCKTRIKGKSIVILVHGAVVPSLSGLHRIDYPNSDKFCFYNLDDLLFHDFQYNVFTFDYADEPIGGLGYVNYGSLEDYGKMLIEAIGKARNFTETSDGSAGQVYVIAHSMGGLVARYAVQNIKDIKVRKIITLDTGHHGFELAKIDTHKMAFCWGAGSR